MKKFILAMMVALLIQVTIKYCGLVYGTMIGLLCIIAFKED